MQSFYLNSSLHNTVLLIHRVKNSTVDPGDFFENIRRGRVGAYAENEPTLDSNEGQWQRVLITDEASITRLFAMKKSKTLYWVQYTSNNLESFALHAKDVDVFVKSLWFIYRD